MTTIQTNEENTPPDETPTSVDTPAPATCVDFLSLMPGHVIKDLQSKLDKYEFPLDQNNKSSMKIIEKVYSAYIRKRERARISAVKARKNKKDKPKEAPPAEPVPQETPAIAQPAPAVIKKYNPISMRPLSFELAELLNF